MSGPTRNESGTATVRRLFEAWSSGDIDAPAAFLTEDASLHDTFFHPDGRASAAGWPAIRSWFERALSLFPRLAMEPVALYAVDDKVLVEWVGTGSYNSDVFGREVAGKTFRFPGMSVFDLRGGKIAKEVDFYNGNPILLGLGNGLQFGLDMLQKMSEG